jgi:hypothetical protein
VSQRRTDATGRRRGDKRAQRAQLLKALARAQALWGDHAAVEGPKLCAYGDLPKNWHPPLALGFAGICSGHHAHGPDCPGGQPYYLVGRVALGLFFSVKGEGSTWDDAFDDVERRAAADRVCYAPDGICTAPRSACDLDRRKARRPARVDPDWNMFCQCGAEMRPKRST